MRPGNRQLRPSIKNAINKVKGAIKTLATPRDITEGGKYKVTKQGTGLVRTKIK